MKAMHDIVIRHELKAGDLGQVAALHGRIYSEEHGFEMGFEAYVMESLVEFYRRYDPDRDRVWVVECAGKMVGFLLLMHREDEQAQLRYFILEKDFRGMGIGKQLMQDWMDFYHAKGYQGAFLYTTTGLDPAVSLYERFGFRKISQVKSQNFGLPLLEIRYQLDRP